MAKADRRIQRTRELRQRALIDLLHERAYDAITIQHIVIRASVGRTTLHLHFRSKDDLLMHCHGTIVGAFQFGPRYPRARTELLSPDAPEGRAAARAAIVRLERTGL